MLPKIAQDESAPPSPAKQAIPPAAPFRDASNGQSETAPDPQNAPAPIRKRIEALHAWYNATTRQAVKLQFHERAWFEFFHAGYNEGDFQLVVNMVLADIKANRRPAGAIQLSVLVGQLDRFDEKLNLSRAQLDPAKIKAQAARVAADAIEKLLAREPSGYREWWHKQGWGDDVMPWHKLDRDVCQRCLKELGHLFPGAL
jgi:hypothetical protein